MKKVRSRQLIPLAVTLGLALTAFSLTSEAQYHRHWREIPVATYHVRDNGLWRGGHWYHGAYAGRLGWWWIVGNTWHYYPRTYYPYPDPGLPPVYIVEAPAATVTPVVVTTAAPVYAPPAQVVQEAPAPAPAPSFTVISNQPPASGGEPIQMVSPTAQNTSPATTQTRPSGAQFYYCSSPKGYFPNVANCPGGWAASPAPAPQ